MHLALYFCHNSFCIPEGDMEITSSIVLQCNVHSTGHNQDVLIIVVPLIKCTEGCEWYILSEMHLLQGGEFA